MFSPVEEAPDQVSGSEDCTMQEETEEQQQEINTEIRITVKEEEEELVNSKGITLKINLITVTVYYSRLLGLFSQILTHSFISLHCLQYFKRKLISAFFLFSLSLFLFHCFTLLFFSGMLCLHPN